MSEHWTQRVGPVSRLTQSEYFQARQHQAAGPVSELLPHTRELYAHLGATHWHLTHAPAGTVLVPVVLVDDPDPEEG